LFDLVQIEPIFPVNEVDSKTQVSETARATNTVEVGFSILWEVKVDDNIDCLNIDTASQQVGANQIATHAISEIMEHSVTVLLKHSSMGVKARVTKLSNFLRKQLNPVGRVTEDD
jgi:hypothetical protein